METTEMGKTKKRSANFSWKETEILLKLTQKFKDIVDDKKTDATVWKKKEETWNKISLIFNGCTSEEPRNARQLKTRYEKIKKDIRRMYRNEVDIDDIKKEIPSSKAQIELKKSIFNELHNESYLENCDKLSVVSDTSNTENIIMHIEDVENDQISNVSWDPLEENSKALAEEDNLDITDMLDNCLPDVKVLEPEDNKTIFSRRRGALATKYHRIANKKERWINILISTARQKKNQDSKEHNKRMRILDQQEEQEKIKTEMLRLELASQTLMQENSSNIELEEN